MTSHLELAVDEEPTTRDDSLTLLQAGENWVELSASWPHSYFARLKSAKTLLNIDDSPRSAVEDSHYRNCEQAVATGSGLEFFRRHFL